MLSNELQSWNRMSCWVPDEWSTGLPRLAIGGWLDTKGHRIQITVFFLIQIRRFPHETQGQISEDFALDNASLKAGIFHIAFMLTMLLILLNMFLGKQWFSKKAFKIPSRMNMHSHRIIAWNWIQHVSETLEWNWSMITSSCPGTVMAVFLQQRLIAIIMDVYAMTKQTATQLLWDLGDQLCDIHEINPKVLMLQASALWTYSSLTTIHFHSQTCLSCIPCTITPLRIIVSWPLMTTQH